ncbi:hypothetical protein RJT34_18062 [Clitoria ternatea]|uniref:Uncharacterized protein n=1 Tax=Clitoria ternatea TaxID=43366 RepID=A0AAN9PFG4_CLITE
MNTVQGLLLPLANATFLKVTTDTDNTHNSFQLWCIIIVPFIFRLISRALQKSFKLGFVDRRYMLSESKSFA